MCTPGLGNVLWMACPDTQACSLHSGTMGGWPLGHKCLFLTLLSWQMSHGVSLWSLRQSLDLPGGQVVRDR